MAEPQISNRKINQIMLITIMVLMGLLIFRKLSFYLPGFLGAITLYILFRDIFFKLTYDRKWNKALTSILFIFFSIVFIIVPVWLLIDYLIPRINAFFSNTTHIVDRFTQVKDYIKDKPILDQLDLSDESILSFLQSLTRYLPKILNSLADVVINLIVTFFVLFFMQNKGLEMENAIERVFPFSEKSKQEIWEEIKSMVKTNALGIPILGLCQGLVAIIGYYIFDVPNPILWGTVTGVATVFPFVGTMAVYVPICIVAFATGDTTNALFLTLYCFLLVGGIDNILRFTILKSLGDVHPLITVFGVLLGLNLFGMLGLIFGPLIISSMAVLLKVYQNEYGRIKIKPE